MQEAKCTEAFTRLFSDIVQFSTLVFGDGGGGDEEIIGLIVSIIQTIPLIGTQHQECQIPGFGLELLQTPLLSEIVNINLA